MNIQLTIFLLKLTRNESQTQVLQSGIFCYVNKIMRYKLCKIRIYNEQDRLHLFEYCVNFRE